MKAEHRRVIQPAPERAGIRQNRVNQVTCPVMSFRTFTERNGESIVGTVDPTAMGSGLVCLTDTGRTVMSAKVRPCSQGPQPGAPL